MEATLTSSIVLFGMAVFLGSVLFVILTWVNTNQQHSNRLLGFYVCFFSYLAFHNLLLYTGLMEYCPYLFRTPRPFNYLPGTLIFLYVRSMLYGEQRFRRWDWLHFTPVIIYALDLIPFYFVSPEEKLAQIRHFMENWSVADVFPEGWLPAEFHNVATALVNYVYMAWAGALLYKASKNRSVSAFRQNTVVFNWLKMFWGLYLFFLTAFYLAFSFRAFLPHTSIIFIQALVVGFLSLSTSVGLLFYPNILYGFQGRMPLQETENQTPAAAQREEEQSIVISEARRHTYLKKLEQIMERERPYLKPRYALTDLATSTGIPYYYLSAVINHEYGWNFNDYINWFRVKHVKNLLNQPEVNQYTLEGVAQMAGFGSRVTFARAFQKFEGCTPTEYLKRHFQMGGQA